MRGKRQRQADDLAVPDLSDDAAERKRVLNVLAQRRYRKRKREQLAALEARLKEKSSDNQDNPSGGSVECHVTEQQEIIINSRGCSADTVNRTDGVDPPDVPASPRTLNQIEEAIIGAMAGDSTASSEPEPSTIIDPARLHDLSGSYISPPPSLGSASGSGTFSGSDLPSPPPVFDSSENNFPEDMSALTFDFLGSSLGLDQLPTQDLSSTLQSHQSFTFSFPDDHLIGIPSLTLLRALLSVASRLNLRDYIWNMNGISPFYTGPAGLDQSSTSLAPPAPPPVESLPPHLRPTPTQRLIPHHPLLDLFPWPTTRDRLIQVFSMSAEFRPPAAADPLGLIGLVYDVEDTAEGMRVSGADPFAPEMWEVGQHLFQRWWWAFEGSIVERSNRLRRQRGAQGLVLGVVD